MFMMKSLVFFFFFLHSICLCPEGTTEIRPLTARQQLIHTHLLSVRVDAQMTTLLS